eukprot:NODE_373_length_8576_cov_0.988557.p1 type:complete len:582 gc:universal NODE_373_length_8576_cov_0.988557:4506-6251(+)
MQYVAITCCFYPNVKGQHSKHLQMDSPQVDNSRLMDKKWQDVQKKTFTKWVNSKLQLQKLKISDLVTDMTDGVKLIELLEIIGDEKLGKFNKTPKMRIQKVENLNLALAYIKSRNVPITNIGAEDILDGNEKLIMGLIWTIILRFSIADISEEGLSAKEGLLLWCQRKTQGYQPDVNIKEFSFSWQDGLAFCALIHRHRPDLLDFSTLNKKDRHGNMEMAFSIAELKLNIPRLLDPEDVIDLAKPDEKSIMTYVAQYFHAFSSMDKVEVSGRRVGKFSDLLMTAWNMQHDYEERCATLTKSIESKIQFWNSAKFTNTYEDARNHSDQFLQFKSTEKRNWIAEKRELDTLLSNIQTKLQTYELPAYHPPQGCTPADLDHIWADLVAKEKIRKANINGKLKEIKDALQQQFATNANQLVNEINKISADIAGVSGELEEQQQVVKRCWTELEKLQDKLVVCDANERECLAANVTENDYTVYTTDDLHFDVSLLQQVIKRKMAFIENQIVAKKNMSGLTPQQLEEIDKTFRHFDKDSSNSLTLAEFKGGLTGLGQVLADPEKLFKELTQGNETMNFQQVFSIDVV